MKVYVTPSGRRNTKKVYHTKQCANSPSDPVEMELETVQSWGFEECQFCGEGNFRSNSPDRSHYESLVEAAEELNS